MTDEQLDQALAALRQLLADRAAGGHTTVAPPPRGVMNSGRFIIRSACQRLRAASAAPPDRVTWQSLRL